MRRLTAIFVPKRSSKSDADSSVFSDTPPSSQNTTDNATTITPKPPKSRSGFFRSLSRNSGPNNSSQSAQPTEPKYKRHPMPALTTGAHPSSSASSSSGGPHTPDDDRLSLVPTEPYRVSSWLHNSGSPPITPVDPRASGSDASLKLLPPIPSLPRIMHEDSDDDTSSEGSSESDATPPSNLQRFSPLTPLAYFQALTVNSTAPPFSPPPLLHLPGCPIYPRSCNSMHLVLTDESLRSLMFRRRLLRRIADGPLSRSDAAALAAFGSKSRSPPRKRPSLLLDDTAVKDAKQIEAFSHGLKWWTNRLCFEDRMVSYVPLQGTREVQALRITGSNFGIAALEFSEGLEALAGLDLYVEMPEDTPASVGYITPSPSLPSTPPTSSSAPALYSMIAPTLPPPQANKIAQSSAAPSQPRSSLYKAAPSPLRMEHTTQSHQLPRSGLPALSSSSSDSSTIIGNGTSPGATFSPKPSVSTPVIALSPNSESKFRPSSQPPIKQGVRFAEEEKSKDDQVPIGYVLRIKQKREEKARFLQLERERRAHEEERRKHQEERRRQEEEKRKWELEREIWNRERKVIEEERKKRLYAEELAAARSRRESTRIGSVPVTTNGSPVMWDGDREREREKRGREAKPTYLRPNYDANPLGQAVKRGMSELSVPLASGSLNGSPGSSRPPSVGGSGSASGSVRGSSRPPSMYSTPPSSATDIHARERHESKASRRGSMASESSQWPGMDRASYSPQIAWGMNPAMISPVPPLPMMPMVPMVPYAIDMPLLPPTPPFMMQQFGPRRPQQRSHSSSPTIGTHRIPSSHSSERVNQHSSSQPSSPHVRGHERRSSGDISELHKSRRLSGSPAESHSHSHDRRSAPSSHRPPHTNSAVSASSSARKNEGYRSSSSARPSGAPRMNTMSASAPVQSMPASTSYMTPTPVLTSSRTQPAFQNLSRPSSNRRQTMIS